MPVAVATDPKSFDEARARHNAIRERQEEAARRYARQQAIAPMVLDEEPEPSPDTLPVARAEWADAILRGDVPTATVRDIIRAVGFGFGLTYADLVGPGRRRDLVRARWAAIHAVRLAKPHLSLPALGRAFGGRDHTTILHAIRTIEAEGVPHPTPLASPLQARASDGRDAS